MIFPTISAEYPRWMISSSRYRSSAYKKRIWSELADQILFLYADERYREEEIIHLGYSAEIVGKIIKRCQRYQFKRRLPPICKLSGRTIGWDFRYLRDWGR